jgi:hypothetical protein
VPRRRRGTWSCGRCAPSFTREHVLVLRRAITGARGWDETT